MSELLLDIFESEFKNVADWQMDYYKRIDWTYDDKRRPMCKTAFGVNLSTEQDPESFNNKINHDPRIFAMKIEEDKESDLLITSSTKLKWESDIIQPDVRDIVLSGKHSNIMPLLYRFA